jgi:hypothetical protein
VADTTRKRRRRRATRGWWRGSSGIEWSRLIGLVNYYRVRNARYLFSLRFAFPRPRFTRRNKLWELAPRERGRFQSSLRLVSSCPASRFHTPYPAPPPPAPLTTPLPSYRSGLSWRCCIMPTRITAVLMKSLVVPYFLWYLEEAERELIVLHWGDSLCTLCNFLTLCRSFRIIGCDVSLLAWQFTAGLGRSFLLAKSTLTGE